jgi:hypothetical protein
MGSELQAYAGSRRGVVVASKFKASPTRPKKRNFKTGHVAVMWGTYFRQNIAIFAPISLRMRAIYTKMPCIVYCVFPHFRGLTVKIIYEVKNYIRAGVRPP